MKLNLPNASSYENYRDFLANTLLQNELSIRQFASLYPEIISFSAVAKLLQKDQRGRYLGTYSFATDTWVRLLKAIGTGEEEILQLALLQWENDAGIMAGKFGAAHLQLMQRLRERVLTSKESVKSGSLSAEALLIARIFDIVNPAFKKRLLREVAKNFELFIGRQNVKDDLESWRKLYLKLKKALG